MNVSRLFRCTGGGSEIVRFAMLVARSRSRGKLSNAEWLEELSLRNTAARLQGYGGVEGGATSSRSVAVTTFTERGRRFRHFRSPFARRGRRHHNGAVTEPAHRVKQRLAHILRELAQEQRPRLEELKVAEHENVKREDWVWHALLEAAASWGSNRGYEGLIQNPEVYAKVTWDALRKVSPSDRTAWIEEALRAGAVRWPAMKARLLDENYESIVATGGPGEAKRRLFAANGRVAKMEFLMTFKGVGDKYARNVMMNLYDTDFRDSIAVDDRIEKVSKAAGLTFDTFVEHEEFYLSVAREAGLNGWETDRLLFHFKDEVLARLGGSRPRMGSKLPCSGSARQPSTRPARVVGELGSLEAGATLIWHKVGGSPTPVTYLRTEGQRVFVHESVGNKMLLRALPPWMLTRA